jgi:hypothetical protein
MKITEIITEAANPKQQAAIAIAKKKKKNMSEATGDQKFDTMMSRMTAEPKYPDKEMIPTSIPELIQWARKNRKPYHEHFAQWARRNGYTNVNDALVWFGDNVDPWDEFGPKDYRDAWDERDVGETLIDAAKHDPEAAELLKVYKCYEEIVFDWPDDYRQMNMPDSRKGTDEGVTEDWNKVNHRDKTSGMSRKAVKAYRRENPGSKLQTAVTTKPSKLKPGSKAAKRRKSFCARMSGNKGPMKKPNGKPTPKALALRRWNCESIEELQELVMLAEQFVQKHRK